jgi:hypothetical protein
MIEPATHENASNAPARLTVAAALALVLAGAAGAQPTPEPEVPVQETAGGAPPRGIDLGHGVTLSGYATVQLLAPFGSGVAPPEGVPPSATDDSQYTQRARLDLSHLSGIAWWMPAPAWKLLGEIDLQNTLQLPGHVESEDGGGAAAYVSLERLYADYRIADSLSVRAGKFLTPIGRWNQEHSDPQTWTVLRPLISQSAFPTNVTGLMAFGSAPVGSQWVDYQLFASNGGEWRSSPHLHPFDSAVGGRVASTLDPHLQIGLSAARFSQSDFPLSTFHLLGVDATWSWRRAEVSAEGIQRQTHSGEAAEEHGWFVQAALPVSERWWIVSRVEAYKRAIDTSTHSSRLLGAVYKRGSRWVFKVEWVDPSPDAVGLPAGLLASLTLAY